MKSCTGNTAANLNFAEVDVFEAMLGIFAQDQSCPPSGGTDLLLQVGQIYGVPNIEGDLAGYRIRYPGINLEIGIGVGESRLF